MFYAITKSNLEILSWFYRLHLFTLFSLQLIHSRQALPYSDTPRPALPYSDTLRPALPYSDTPRPALP